MALVNAQERKLYISNQLMTDDTTPHDDCDFSVDLGTTFAARRMVLGAIAIENYFLNLDDLSLVLNGVSYTIIPEVYLT
jgi:hypothetical protein